MSHTVFLDTETTHLDPTIGAAWEFAFIVEGHPDSACDGEWSFMIPDVDIKAADPTSLRIGRFLERAQPVLAQRDQVLEFYRTTDVYVAHASDDVLSDHEEHWRQRSLLAEPAPPLWWTHRLFARWVARVMENATIIGVRPEFDLPFIAKYVAQYHGPIAHHYHTIDVAQVTLGRYSPVPRTYSSHGLSEAVGCPLPADADRHTALGDARWARRWLAALDATAIAEDR